LLNTCIADSLSSFKRFDHKASNSVLFYQTCYMMLHLRSDANCATKHLLTKSGSPLFLVGSINILLVFCVVFSCFVCICSVSCANVACVLCPMLPVSCAQCCLCLVPNVACAHLLLSFRLHSYYQFHLSSSVRRWHVTFQQGVLIFRKAFWKIIWEYSLSMPDLIVQKI
jgi:hypothetical protein